MSSHGNGLTPAQCRAVAALLSERDVAAAAVKAKVGDSTLRRWLREPAFRQELLEAQREIVTAARAQLVAGVTEAVQALRTLLRSDNPHVVARAALGHLDQVLQTMEKADHGERLAALEEKETRRQAEQLEKKATGLR
jgi:hypothetical protein